MKNRSSKRTLTKCAEIDDIIDAVAKRCSCKESITQLKEAPMKVYKVATYLTKRFSSLTNNKISKVFGITYSVASKTAGNNEKLISKDRCAKKVVGELISQFKSSPTIFLSLFLIILKQLFLK